MSSPFDPQLGQDITDEIERLWVAVEALQKTVRDQQSLHGWIASDGSVVGVNDGIVVTKNGTGDYSIDFDHPFDDTPIIKLSAGPTAGSIGIRLDSTTMPSTTGFRVRTFTTTTGAAADSAFEFTATHP